MLTRQCLMMVVLDHDQIARRKTARGDADPDLQSAYRAYHSTKTAVLKVLTDILSALNSGNLAMLTLVDLSAAFDSVNHHTIRPMPSRIDRSSICPLSQSCGATGQ